MDTVTNLINFAKPFYLNGDFYTYDEFTAVILDLLTEEQMTEYRKARIKLEKSNDELLQKYVAYFSLEHEIDEADIWVEYVDD
ncbi:MAG: hypothetical protein V7L27_03545 [Nostoc sp.]|uniref:hypothetical protein n=1 Tax=Nostoc sp. TaxID=1180 RepID=UPI002FFB6FC3